MSEKIKDLSDVSMDNDDDEAEIDDSLHSKVLTAKHHTTNWTLGKLAAK